MLAFEFPILHINSARCTLLRTGVTVGITTSFRLVALLGVTVCSAGNGGAGAGATRQKPDLVWSGLIVMVGSGTFGQPPLCRSLLSDDHVGGLDIVLHSRHHLLHVPRQTSGDRRDPPGRRGLQALSRNPLQ